MHNYLGVDCTTSFPNLSLSACENSDVPKLHHGACEAESPRAGAELACASLRRERPHEPRSSWVMSELLIDLQNAVVQLELLEVAGVDDELGTLVQGHGVAQAAGTLRAHRLQSSDQSWGHSGVGYPSSLKIVKTVREKQAVRNSDCVSPCFHATRNFHMSNAACDRRD